MSNPIDGDLPDDDKIISTQTSHIDEPHTDGHGHGGHGHGHRH